MNLPLLLLEPPQAYALGATAGQDCLAPHLDAIRSAEQDGHAVVLDLSKVEAINASYLKATVFWALQCGQAYAQQKQPTRKEEWAVQPLNLYPAVATCSKEVEDEVTEFFCGRNLPLLHLKRTSGKPKQVQRILGTLDPVLERTHATLVSLGEGTAADLANESEDQISVNGWNNRLADLYLLRLVTRRRQGKFLIYKATSTAIQLWD